MLNRKDSKDRLFQTSYDELRSAILTEINKNRDEEEA